MHAERKEDLDSNQRTKSKYAIPTLNAFAQGLNAKEEQYYKKKGKKKFILEYNFETEMIICNYKYLKKHAKDCSPMLRQKEHIDAILKEYSRLQNGSE